MRRRGQDPLQPEANQSQASNTVGPVRVTADDIQANSVHRSPSFTSSKKLRICETYFSSDFCNIDDTISMVLYLPNRNSLLLRKRVYVFEKTWTNIMKRPDFFPGFWPDSRRIVAQLFPRNFDVGQRWIRIGRGCHFNRQKFRFLSKFQSWSFQVSFELRHGLLNIVRKSDIISSLTQINYFLGLDSKLLQFFQTKSSRELEDVFEAAFCRKKLPEVVALRREQVTTPKHYNQKKIMDTFIEQPYITINNSFRRTHNCC